MSTVLWIAGVFRQVLVPFLIGAAIVFVSLLIGLVIQRAVRSGIERRRLILISRFQPLIERCIGATEMPADRVRVLRFGRRSPMLLGRMIVQPLLSLAGAPVENGAALAKEAGVIDFWRSDMRDRRWWRRAEANRSLGVVRDETSFPAFVSALDDTHEEVRAAAVEALGRLGDLRAVQELLARLPEQSRHQRVRIIDALGRLGAEGAATLMDFVRRRPDVLPFVADLVPAICGSAAADEILALCDHESDAVRAAAFNALGTIGLDDTNFYYALKALGDADPGVRSMAARALGRSGREDVASYLAERLDEADWSVAAASARALLNLGIRGAATLAESAKGQGQAAELAKQMLWEQQARSAAMGSA